MHYRRNPIVQRTLQLTVSLFASFVVLISCERADDAEPETTSADTQHNHREQIPNWEVEVSRITIDTASLQNEEFENAMATAIAKARQTAAEAQMFWEATDDNDKRQWLIKWAAPANGSVEYLWVLPVTWSPFRVEGILATMPVQSSIDFEVGDMVSFPIEELVDWVHRLEGTMDGPRRGGFTVDVIEEFLGAPDAE